MADVLTSNLYPPIVDTFMPAFIGNSCRVYFELSNFNTLSDIDNKLIQVSVRAQHNNENVLKNWNGIRFYEMQTDSQTGKLYIEIHKLDLEEEKFDIDQYYKVQIRFTKSGLIQDYDNEQYYAASKDNPSINWINNNLTNFSEWSTVCLIKRIKEPQLYFYNFDQYFASDSTYYWNPSPFLRLNGYMYFIGGNEEQYLKSYNLTLTMGNITEESGVQYPDLSNNLNKIRYNFKTKLEPNKVYNLNVHIVTNDLYEKTVNYSVKLEEESHTHLVVNPIEDIDQGRIKIESYIPDSTLNGIYYTSILRSSSKDNFEVWEEIGLVSFNANSSATFFDYSVESGTWYKYVTQLFNGYGYYIGSSPESEAVSILYEEMYLNSQGKQLKMSFDSRITSYKRMVLENKVETLGSPFPFVRRNSATNYRQFSITGLISFHTDEEKIFLTEDQIYGGGTSTTEKYHEYNLNHKITPYNDYIKEREFREKVINYLNSGKVFLLRTMTEGLALVRLMDINLTPNQSLNNYIYTFTATAIEVAECTPENFYKYKVFSGMYSSIQLLQGAPS